MVGGIGSLSQYASSLTSSGVSNMSSIYDYQSAQKNSASMLSAFKSNRATVKTLTTASANFLTQYTNSMKALDQSAGKLRGLAMNDVLYNKEGEVTTDTVKATVGAVKQMVDEYNSSLKTLNANADRGAGVVEQIARMADDIAPASSMKMVGLSMKDDATLALDEAALTAALKTDNKDQLALYKDILSGSTGVAAGIQKDAQKGLNTAAARLISDDLANMKSIQKEDPIFQFSAYSRSGAYAMNNMAVVGMMMNLAV